MASDGTTQLDEVADAERAVAEAQALVARIEDDQLEGPGDYTTADLLEAEAEVEKRRSILHRALDIRRVRQERAAEKARKTRVAELDALIVANFGRHEGDLVDLFDEAVEALTPFVAAAVDRNKQLNEMRNELRKVEPLPEPRLTIHHDGEITAHGVRIGMLNVEALVSEIAMRALRAAGQTVPEGLRQAAQTNSEYQLFEHYGVERGDLVGPSNRLRNLARTVAGDPPPPHVPKAKQAPAGYIVPDLSA